MTREKFSCMLKLYMVRLSFVVLLCFAFVSAGDSVPLLHFSVQPLNYCFGKEGASYNPGLQLRTAVGRLGISLSGAYTAWNSIAGDELIKRHLEFPSGWEYGAMFTYVTNNSERDLTVADHSVTYSNKRYIGNGVYAYDVTYYTSAPYTEHNVYSQALRFGVSGGQKNRDFTADVDKLNENGEMLHLRDSLENDLYMDMASGSLCGTVVQHRAFIGYEWAVRASVKGVNTVAMKLSADLLVHLDETLNSELADYDKVYVKADDTHSIIGSHPLGFLCSGEILLWHFYTKAGFGYEPGSGGALLQLGWGFWLGL